jgi:E3 ubiquitin-protein ligase UBR4
MITVLHFQLSALVKQAGSSQTLTSLSSAPFSFTDLFNIENFLAVSGLKDLLGFKSSCGVSDQLVLQTQPVWLPGSQTQLAVVTAESVKIYDFPSDSCTPAYSFLVPSHSGKIRDVTFVGTVSGDMFLLQMSVAGHIYFQQLCVGSVSHGPFYVTNIIEVSHGDMSDPWGSLAGVGVSIYYTLHMLLVTEEKSAVFLIQVRNT